MEVHDMKTKLVYLDERVNLPLRSSTTKRAGQNAAGWRPRLAGLRVVDWKGAVLIGVWLWIGSYATLLVDSVLYAGNGLVKILLMTVILDLLHQA
jgi:hypothetical protein